MLIFHYHTKKELATHIGETLVYTETSIFGQEFRSNGEILGCNRPTQADRPVRMYIAKVTMKDGLIQEVK